MDERSLEQTDSLGVAPDASDPMPSRWKGSPRRQGIGGEAPAPLNGLEPDSSAA
jgi:hypothetical protein